MDMRRVKHHKAQVDQYQDLSRLSTKRCKQYKDQVRDWSSLPGGVVEKISDNLCLYDYLCFSNVCKSWRSYQEETLQLHGNRSSGFPCLVMSKETESETACCISLLEKNKLLQLEMPSFSGGLFRGCIKDWLIILKPFTKFYIRRMSLLNPFTGSKVDLPNTSYFNSKVVFSGDPGKQNCVYMLFHYKGTGYQVWIPEAKYWCECGLQERTDDVLIDLICFKGCFYLLTMEYNIRVLDAAHAYSAIQRQGYKEQIDTRFYEIEMSSDIPRDNIRHLDVQIFRYLVEFGDEILLVIRFLRNWFEETYDFKVFRLDLCKKEWVKLDNLGDCVIFAGRNCSRCYSAKELGGGMGNCIYFTNSFGLLSEMDCENELSCSLENDDWGIFRLNSDGSERFSYLAKIGKRPPVWLTAPLWWYFNKFRP